MSTKEKAPSARWLQDADGNVRLYAGEDIEAAKINGLKEPTGRKSNGEEWNPEPEEGEQSQADAAAALAKANAEHKAKVSARKEKEAEAARKAAGEPEEQPPKADMRVEIVEPQKPAKAKK